MTGVDKRRRNWVGLPRQALTGSWRIGSGCVWDSHARARTANHPFLTGFPALRGAQRDLDKHGKPLADPLSRSSIPRGSDGACGATNMRRSWGHLRVGRLNRGSGAQAGVCSQVGSDVVRDTGHDWRAGGRDVGGCGGKQCVGQCRQSKEGRCEEEPNRWLDLGICRNRQ